EGDRSTMTLAIRLILILSLLVPVTGAVSAQEATTATETAAAETTTTPAVIAAPNIRETRAEFSTLLRQHPWELGRILALDARLLTNEAFLSGYPAVAEYIAAHPEIVANPRFYLAEFRSEPNSGVIDGILDPMIVMTTIALIAFALAWLLRTIIEQKRWNRLSRQQAEVHNKILDRFGSSNELLDYVRTPAGAKFLESAPIPLHSEKPASSSPVTRGVMWSIQIGVVVAAAALGMLMVSLRLDTQAGEDLFALGVIGFCVGAGFIASALVSLVLSRRLGLWQNESEPVR
ncbi:MAG TPA: hypothetical protein VM779_15905, partial [Thermoanaerobaculia bacterium]|nr:hypothetical protein [Thermoanaerobaculia bacterium]